VSSSILALCREPMITKVADESAEAEIMGGRDKPGHDEL
jgi:hypothetical protein